MIDDEQVVECDDQALLRSTLLAHLLDENLTPSSIVDFHRFTLHRGSIVTDSLIYQVCEFNPNIKIISLENCCEDVTDLGILAISKHCRNLEDIKVSDCSRLTHVGVRGLALNCTRLKKIQFKRCSQINDGCLRIIAANVKSLEHLVLEGCLQVSDIGVSEVAQWCINLRSINLSSCIKIGELGDKSLRVIGSKSHFLECLDLTGCSNVSDKAMKALSCCRHLTHLKLSGCDLLTGKSIRDYITIFANLTELALANCCRIGDVDLANLVRKCSWLHSLNVSFSPAFTLVSLDSILKHCLHLEELDISGNAAVDDYVLEFMTKNKTATLSKLTMQYCHCITEEGVENMTRNARNLLHLDLTGCQGIQNLFIYQISPNMLFSDVSRSFLGFEPKTNAKKLIEHHEYLIRESESVLLLQRVIRGFIAQVREVRKVRLARQNAVVAPMIQAVVRGFIGRSRAADAKTLAATIQATLLIQVFWRQCKARQDLSKKMQLLTKLRKRGVSSSCIQRVFRGHYYGRNVVRHAKAQKLQDSLDKANERASRLIACCCIQRSLKCAFSRKHRLCLVELKKLETKRHQQLYNSVTVFQKHARLRYSRKMVSLRREDYRARNLCELKATKLQAAWRYVTERRISNRESQRRRDKAAVRLQAMWHKIFSIRNFAKFELQRIAQNTRRQSAIAVLQRIARLRARRSSVQRNKQLKQSLLRQSIASVCIQSSIRCYLCRERMECQKDLKNIEARMNVLFPKSQSVSQELRELDSKIAILTSEIDYFEKEKDKHERELRLINETSSKYWDTDRITGIPQRFLKSVISTQLKRILHETIVSMEMRRTEMDELTKQRQAEKWIFDSDPTKTN